MRFHAAVCLSLAALLVGCSAPATPPPAEMNPAAGVMGGTAEAPAADRASAAGKAQAPATATPQMLAYSYSYVLELPGDGPRNLIARHQAACEAAGPAVCQIVSAATRKAGDDDVEASLMLRAAPAWLAGFRRRIEEDAGKADGRVIRASTESEDLTRNIVDTEAMLRAQTALAARLERLLAERPGNLADALAIEQELARVRATIDAARSQIEVMRGRVSMSALSIEYLPRGGALSRDDASPVVSALKGFFGNTLIVVSALITLLSFLLPLALVAVPVIWWIQRRRKRAFTARRPTPNGDN
jgi:hypothetical protein